MSSNRTNTFLIAVITTIIALIVTCSLVFMFSMFDKTTFLLRMKEPVELVLLIVCSLFTGICSIFWAKIPIPAVRAWTFSWTKKWRAHHCLSTFYCLEQPFDIYNSFVIFLSRSPRSASRLLPDPQEEAWQHETQSSNDAEPHYDRPGWYLANLQEEIRSVNHSPGIQDKCNHTVQ